MEMQMNATTPQEMANNNLCQILLFFLLPFSSAIVMQITASN
jgi:hypothetical protein